jgi:hypothetical protein
MGNIQRERVEGRGKNLTSLKVVTDRDISEKAHDLGTVLDDPSDWPNWNSFVQRVVDPEMLPFRASLWAEAVTKNQGGNLFELGKESFPNLGGWPWSATSTWRCRDVQWGRRIPVFPLEQQFKFTDTFRRQYFHWQDPSKSILQFLEQYRGHQ